VEIKIDEFKAQDVPFFINSALPDYTQARHTRRKRVSSAMDGKLKSIHGSWIPAQICLEQICINPNGDRQDSLL
jgi:hypothetical protein